MCIYSHIYTHMIYIYVRGPLFHIYIFMCVCVLEVLHFPTDLDHIIFFIDNTDESLSLK